MDNQPKRKYQNAIVIACAAGASFAAICANTSLFSKSHSENLGERERCYGVTKAGQNDCATATHSCAQKSPVDHDPNEWIMLPKGTCSRLVGGRSD